MADKALSGKPYGDGVTLKAPPTCPPAPLLPFIFVANFFFKIYFKTGAVKVAASCSVPALNALYRQIC